MVAAILGLDIGGANLKAFHTAGAARINPFALWRNPAGLVDALRALTDGLPAADAVVVTMTGELCDCFASKRAGVAAILDAVQALAGSTPIWVWLTDGTFGNPAAAREAPLRAASANWLALATFAGRFGAPGTALLLDVGSTTTDIIPLKNGKAVALGETDPERLLCQELVYTGARRTPICALLGSQVAAEFFATTLDAYLVLGEVPENPADTDTADGRPATRALAHARLARMLCADLETSTEEERLDLAARAAARQVEMIATAMNHAASRLAGPPKTIILAGSGEHVAAKALASTGWTSQVVSLRQEMSEVASAAACACAVAVLAAER
jgi:(4-(4-[2-(gamma-L-glutamylamino)ethyl]phenoxymethyl)furan-2-yl)methanamine synthase